MKLLSLKFGNDYVSWKKTGAFELECSFRNGLNPLQCTVSNSSLTATISGWFSLAHHMSWIKMWQLICKDAFQVISVFFSNNMEFYLSCCSWAHKKEEEIRCPTPISHLKDQFWLERPLKKNKWLVTLYYFILFAWEQKWFRLPRRNCDKCTT